MPQTAMQDKDHWNQPDSLLEPEHATESTTRGGQSGVLGIGWSWGRAERGVLRTNREVFLCPLSQRLNAAGSASASLAWCSFISR